jgi:hypothetical protein
MTTPDDIASAKKLAEELWLNATKDDGEIVVRGED